MIHIIAAIAENGIIGKDNTMPWNLPADLAHFKALTMGHTMIMGRRTYQSIGRILPGRESIIVSGTLEAVDGAVVVPTLEQALALSKGKEVYIIGGAMLYQAALPLAEQLDITWVAATPEGDTHFPPVDWSQYEEVCREFCPGTLDCTFVTYRKK